METAVVVDDDDDDADGVVCILPKPKCQHQSISQSINQLVKTTYRR